MHSLRTFLFTGALLCTFLAQASNLQVIDVQSSYQFYPQKVQGYQFTVQWDNSWHNDRNHDAAWVFLKAVEENGYNHLPLKPGSARILWKGSPDMPDPELDEASDGTGLFVYASEPYRGPLTYRIFVELDAEALGDNQSVGVGFTQGYGIEMVYIPEGGFTLGDPKETALDYYAFYESGPDSTYQGLYRLDQEKAAIEVGPDEGQLFYRSNSAQYRGDQQGPIPAEFPKGVQAFYLMKYEVTQGIYADFLNSLNYHSASIRYPGGTPDYRRNAGTICLEDGQFFAERPEQRMNFMHWDDMMAFMDWAALRPYTELEYTKASRGPLDPKPNEYAWNNSTVDLIARMPDPTKNYMEMINGMTEADLNDDNRVYFGASYYWVFDLCGSMWEKVITIGDPVGRAFRGQHGDGDISGYGFADVEGWPRGYTDSEGGYGYRGGGHYGEPWLSNDNPYSPIGHRRYAAWSGGMRREAYGTRAARTAN